MSEDVQAYEAELKGLGSYSRFQGEEALFSASLTVSELKH